MAVKNLIPTTNVKAADIRDTLNYYGGTVTNDTTTFFTTAAKINHWAKYKPTKFNATFSDPDDSSPWWKGTDGNCGFSVASTTVYTDIPDMFDGNMNGWKYVLPTGGSTYPFRLGDFRGYDPDAPPMISNFYIPEKVSNQFSGNTVLATAAVAADNSSSVSVGDLALSSYYACVIITDSTGTVKQRSFSLYTLGESFSLYVMVSGLSAGTYTVYPCVCTKNAVGASGARYYTLPNINPRTMTIVTSYFNIAPYVETTGSTRQIKYTITIYSGTTDTWTTNTWRLRYNEKEFSDAMTTGETSGSLDSTINLTSGGTTTLTGTLTVPTALWNLGTFSFWVSFDSGNHIARFIYSENTQE